jgi:hypothetical protein
MVLDSNVEVVPSSSMELDELDELDADGDDDAEAVLAITSEVEVDADDDVEDAFTDAEEDVEADDEVEDEVEIKAEALMRDVDDDIKEAEAEVMTAFPDEVAEEDEESEAADVDADRCFFSSVSVSSDCSSSGSLSTSEMTSAFCFLSPPCFFSEVASFVFVVGVGVRVW